MSWIDWESEAYPSNEDLLMVPVFALFFPSVRFFLDRFIFERLARRFVPGSAKGASQDQQDECNKRHIKFKESAWKCIYYLSAEIIALAVTYNEPWFTNTGNFWVGPGDQVWPDQKVKTKLKALYMYTAGFYTYGIFALIFWETRRSDFGVSMAHHVATVILIILSYLLRFARVGSIVLALHDASDVFLEVGKMFKYNGSNIVPSISFLLFVISWVVLRLIYYPFWILWSTRYHYTKDFEADGEVKEGLYKCIKRMVPDSVKQDEIHSKLLHFNESIGTFGMAMAVRGRARDPPAYWWQQFGSQCHELQKFAVRILSQTCSASGCERNWSVFERIHTKKRNRLEQKRLNDMVFVQYNLRLRRNQLMNKTPESSNIFLDDIDPSSDWVVETQPAAFDHDDLSWMDLDPEPHQENVATDVAQPAPVSLPSGPGESSQAQNPPVQSTHVENVESDDDSESDSESSEASFQYADSDY